MRIYTRAGDAGWTTLGDARWVLKDDSCIEVCGALDELNASLGEGVVQAEQAGFSDWVAALRRVQNDLLDMGAEVAHPDRQLLTLQHVQRLEEEMDTWSTNLPPLRSFLLPGGSPLAAFLQRARAVARRAERRLVAHSKIAAQVPKNLLIYANRLADWLFVLARSANARSQVAEVLYVPTRASQTEGEEDGKG